ncbi:microfibril-associated glycoprotein 4-like [Sardina pilchardus]|uniref:microfibril-associated glycoprotein 4-like n=1 Tax=Sardina pilchardus TaxID=27697 RepID=UPI002E147370
MSAFEHELLETLQEVLFILLALIPTCFTSPLPLDCADVQSQNPTKPSGVYTIFPGGPISPLQVYCDMETDGGGWTVFQRRMDGSVNFYRGWDQYKEGFGNKDGEYWLGLENIELLTTRIGKYYQLRVDMEDWEGGKGYALYQGFRVDPENYGYALGVGKYLYGTAGDSLAFVHGMRFTTYDRDQDYHEDNCAKLLLGAFWYKAGSCSDTNPNGIYAEDSSSPFSKNIFVVWAGWNGINYSLKGISFKIRPT